jgi:sec-independent protein translocase protein TatB
MFDIGFWELAVIGLLALIVLGPRRLPEVARTAGRWARSLRRFVENVKHDLDRELNTAELVELRKLKQELSDTRQAIEKSTGDVIGSFKNNFDDLSSTSDTESSARAQRSSKQKAVRRVAGKRSAKRVRKPSARKKHAGTKRTRSR